MSVEKDILEQVCPDITITRARYAELLIAEADANRLKKIISKKANEYLGMTHDEIKLLDGMFSDKREEATDD